MERSILDAVGSPLVQVTSPTGSIVAAKLESKNPGGSAKDRAALAMVEAAERDGTLSPSDSIVEPTSGNTGIGIAMVGAAKGYDVRLVLPASKSEERKRIMRAYGADLELVEGDIGAARERADELEREGDAVQLRQFENPANPEAHYRTTGAEILEQIGDRTVDAFVAGVGTGGTISGIGRRLRAKFPDVRIVAVEPEDSAVLSGEEAGIDAFQGMGPGFVSPNLDRDLIDDVRTVGIDAAEAECRRLAREEGILVGQSSGGTNLIAREVAGELADPSLDCPAVDADTDVLADGAGNSRAEPARSNRDASRPAADDCPLVVTVFWDSGERYMSAGTFD